jgi:protein ImuB
MARLACVDLPAFPLQLLLRDNPDWAGFPSAVIEADKPQAHVLWASELARKAGVLSGQRYAYALGLAPGLRAGVVARAVIDVELERVSQLLRRLSPDVEPYADEPGVFWLSGEGLSGIFPNASAWGRAIVAALGDAGYGGSVVVGFTRFGSYAVSRRGAPLVVFRNPDAERRATHGIPLSRLGMDPELRDWVLKLGVETLGSYIALPPDGLLVRFGRDALKLHQLAAGSLWDPLRPAAPPDEPEASLVLDDAEEDSTRLLFLIKGALDRLLARLAERREAMTVLLLELVLEGEAPQREAIRCAEPTLDHRVVLRLLHLRLESCPPAAGVKELYLRAESVPARAEQLALFFERPRRDLAAANAALAELRAELGDDAVCRAVLCDGHLPEAQFEWTPLASLSVPRPALAAGERRLVRRIHGEPLLVPPVRGSLHDDGWLLSGLEYGSVMDMRGPHVVSGGWWQTGFVREYAFARTKRGECLWVYYDRKARRWYVQGVVE